MLTNLTWMLDPQNDKASQQQQLMGLQCEAPREMGIARFKRLIYMPTQTIRTCLQGGNDNLRFSRHEHTRKESHRQHTPKIAGIKPLANLPYGTPKKKQGALILLLDSQGVNRSLITQYKGEK